VDNIRGDLREIWWGKLWTQFTWFRKGTSDEFLWAR